jgi:hypothetical protein
MRSFLFAALAVLVVSSFSLQAAQPPYKLLVSPVPVPAAHPGATAPAIVMGLVEAGLVGTTPCWGDASSGCPGPVGSLQIPDPEVK